MPSSRQPGMMLPSVISRSREQSPTLGDSSASEDTQQHRRESVHEYSPYHHFTIRGSKGLTRKLTLGVCCMQNKATSNPMQSLLRRLDASGAFNIIIFDEKMILEQDVSEWPIVQCYVSFHSKGFPLYKSLEYVKMRHPVEINKVEDQLKLRNRLTVYETLKSHDIPCPDYMAIDHLEYGDHQFVEADDYIIYDGRKLKKPFVEKPLDGDDHNIWIYYPTNVGGGCKKLFRKIGDKSSEFDAKQSRIRKDKKYIYEPFLPTGGMDVKVYMVGEMYSHAEARKAPTVDGKVMRNNNGKEIRYPITLSEVEKACGALIVQAFGQFVTGFDVLRTTGRSIVCDVNGWSFVKGNQRYYDDCAILVQKFFLDRFHITFTMPIPALKNEDRMSEPINRTTPEVDEADEENFQHDKLRAVMIIMRHGDRKPKEKHKFKSSHRRGRVDDDDEDEDNSDIGISGKSPVDPHGEVLIKSPEEMKRLLGKVKAALQEPGLSEKDRKNIDTLKMVLDLHEHFTGLNRKIQFKPIKFGINDHGVEECTEVQVVAKWGGELTSLGRNQAETLGRRLRQELFPINSDDCTSLLRLHSTFRHDFKIYSSHEGRCQTTAAAFTKGFLDLEGDLPPILVSLVCVDGFARKLLDRPIPKEDRNKVKQMIDTILHTDSSELRPGELLEIMAPTDHKGTAEAARMIGNPLITMRKVGELCLSFLDLISTEIARLAEKHKLDSVDYSEFDDGSPINGSSSPNALPEDPTSPVEGDVGSSPETPQSNESEASPVRGHRRLRSWTRGASARGRSKGFLSFVGEKLRDRFSSTPFASFIKKDYAIGPGPKLPHELQDRVKRRYIQLQRIEHRWKKLVQGFLSPPRGEFDTTKVPDLWDCVYYDLVHHRNDVPPAALNVLEEMSLYLIPLQNWTSPSEFGIDKEDKIRIGVETSWRLIQKLINDSEFMLDEITDSGQPRSNANAQTVGFDATGTPTLLPALSMASTPSKNSTKNSPTNAVRQCIVHSHRFKDSEESSSGAAREGSTETKKSSGSATRSSSGENSKRREGSLEKANRGAAAPELRAQLRQAMRDGSDWHPKLHETVAQITGMKSTSKCVRTRIYVTSASTMHSLLNVLVNGDDEHMKSPIDPAMIRDITDLHYLTHISLRVFEADDYDGPSSVHDNERRNRTVSSQSTRQDLTRYRVEIGLSPGVQVVDQTATGLQINHYPPGNRIRESELEVAPLKPVINIGTLKNYYTLQELDTYLTSTLAKFHHCVDSDSEPETDNHPDDGERSMSPMAFESTTS